MVNLRGWLAIARSLGAALVVGAMGGVAPAIAQDDTRDLLEILERSVVRGNLTYQVGGCVDKACAPKGRDRAAEAPYGVGPEANAETDNGTGAPAIAPEMGVLNLTLEGGGGTLNFAYDRTANCCMEFELSESRDGNTIDVVEANGGMVCRCLCEFNLTGTIQNLAPGLYRVRLFQNSRRGGQQLVTTRQVEVNP